MITNKMTVKYSVTPNPFRGILRPQADNIQSSTGSTIAEDLEKIFGKIKTYEAPVATKAELPTHGNDDGDVRLVLNENLFYIWDEPSGQWVVNKDTRAEGRSLRLIVEEDNQQIFDTHLQINVQDGIANLDSIMLQVNGITQVKDIDFSLEGAEQYSPSLKIH